MKLIDIALATYNGEAYIREQITSIKSQSYSNWRLLISDDNSSDGTLSIISELMQTDSRICLVNSSRQGGVVRNFNNALLATKADYVVLSDQDDIWPVERLEKMMEKIESLEDNNALKPILVFTDLTLINDKNEFITSSFYKANHLDPIENIKGYNLLWRSSVYGCTTIMNRSLLSLALPIPDYALMHDHWLALVAYKNAGLNYFDYSSIGYRQHANNVVGGSNKNVFGKLKTLRKSMKIITLQTLKTKKLLEENDFYHKKFIKGKRVNIILFAFKEILPYAFVGNKKIYSLFTFISFVINK